MKPLRPIAVVVLTLCFDPAFADPARSPAKTPAAAEKAVSMEFPLVFKGKEIVISRQSKRPELEPKLTKILGKKTAMDDPDTLQYDVQFDPAQAPFAVVLSWDKKGGLAQITLDASEEVQNPPAKELKRWLTKNAGAGKTTKNKQAATTSTTWLHRGWRFVFTQGGDGEDSTYGFRITPQKAS
jgi:hypothetical protein